MINQDAIYKRIKKHALLKKMYEVASRIRTLVRKRLSDEEFIKLKFKEKTGTVLDLNNPTTYNEKIQYLKIHDRNPLYTKLTDKYAVREWYKEKIGEKYLIPLYGVYDSFDQIDFESLPNQFVMKCTHDCGSIIICTDKRTFNKKRAKKKLTSALKRNYYWGGREWNYKDIPPRIIVEKYMVDESGVELKDYKFYCFNGRVELVYVDFNRHIEHKCNLYTLDWDFIDATIGTPNDKNVMIKKPCTLDAMIKIAKELSDGMPHVRVDLYSIGHDIFCGEMTFHDGGGMAKFTPESLGIEMGNCIDLSLAYDNQARKNK